MVEPYSLDLRKRAVALLDEGASSLEVAEMLGVSESWVRKMRLRRARLGHLLPSKPPGKERILTEAHHERLCQLVFDQPDATLEELVELVAKNLKVDVSISTLSRRLIEVGLTRKKKSLHASESERPEIQQERERFLRRSIIRRAPRLLFIDETGINLSMTRMYARAPAGMRAVDAVPKNWGDNVTVTAALTLDGIVAPMMLHGAMDTLAFEGYIEHFLAPELRPGDVVVLDRLNAHKGDRVRQLVEAHDARLVYLPAYSPDFNPIENAWSKLKAKLRKAKARTVRKLHRALRWALLEITSNDAHGWFSHCGFPVPCL